MVVEYRYKKHEELQYFINIHMPIKIYCTEIPIIQCVVNI